MGTEKKIQLNKNKKGHTLASGSYFIQYGILIEFLLFFHYL